MALARSGGAVSEGCRSLEAGCDSCAFDQIRQLWTEELTAEEHVALIRSASDHRLMEPAKREWLFEQMRELMEARPGGRIRKHNLTLHLARRLA
jgi:hypothetical protein